MFAVSSVPALAGAGVDLDEAVVVRLVDLNAPAWQLSEAESCLTVDELVLARRGTRAVHRRRVFVRAALRTALADVLDLDAAHVPLTCTATGRPHVTGRSDVDFSCSASAGLGVVAIARGRRIGVDVEQVFPWSDDVLDQGWLSLDEQRALVALPVAARAEVATRVWTRKEAVLKARGTGLLEDPSTVATPLVGPAGVIAGWAVHDLPVPGDWVASLAVGPCEEISI